MYAQIIGGIASHLQGYASELDPDARRYKKTLRNDYERMRNGNLGPSEAQKAAALAQSQRAIQATQAQGNADIAQQAAAAGNLGRSGAYFGAMQQNTAAAQEQTAQAAGAIESSAQQVAAAQRTEILNRMERQYDRKKEEFRNQGRISEQTTQGITGGGGGGGGGPNYINLASAYQ